jgi:hypothetical protein
MYNYKLGFQLQTPTNLGHPPPLFNYASIALTVLLFKHVAHVEGLVQWGL